MGRKAREAAGLLGLMPAAQKTRALRAAARVGMTFAYVEGSATISQADLAA